MGKTRRLPVPVLEGHRRAGDVAADLDDRAAEPARRVLDDQVELDRDDGDPGVRAPPVPRQHVVGVAISGHSRTVDQSGRTIGERRVDAHDTSRARDGYSVPVRPLGARSFDESQTHARLHDRGQELPRVRSRAGRVVPAAAPGSSFTTLVVDAEFGLEDRDEPFQVLTPAELDLSEEEFHRMAVMYDVTELSTALKPWTLRYLIEHGAEAALYIDPDIQLFSPSTTSPRWWPATAWRSPRTPWRRCRATTAGRPRPTSWAAASTTSGSSASARPPSRSSAGGRSG